MQPHSTASLAWVIIGVALSGLGAHRATAAEPAISYATQIRPILSDKCFACHGPDQNSREADLRLDTPEGAVASLGDHAAIVAGDPDASELMVRIVAKDESIMPPVETQKSLTPEEVELLRAWIAQGAKYEQHWSYRKIVRPEVPKVANVETASPIDAFLREKMELQGLDPSSPADKSVLLKRLSLDLWGLPPSAELEKSFLADTSAEAREHLVDQLLADVRFGERMAVVWLDLVRYADSIGYHSDRSMEVSPYRDYVINSFHQNKPYDQFTVEQLAGDLLPNATREQVIASGYNRLLQTTQEGGAQAKEYIAIYSADRVRNVSEAWLGATVGCAQCHDHKFDPYTIKEFYSLAAFFGDITERAIGAREYNLLVPTAKEERDLKVIDAKLIELDTEKVLATDPQLAAKLLEEQRRWEKGLRKKLPTSPSRWISPAPTEYKATRGLSLELLPDNTVLARTDRLPSNTDYTVRFPVTGRVRALRLDCRVHESFAGKNRFATNNRDFLLTDFQVEADGKEIEITSAEATLEGEGTGVAGAVDDDPSSAWGVAPKSNLKQVTAVFRLADALDATEGAKEMVVTLRHQAEIPQHFIGRFRLSYSEDADAPIKSDSPRPQQVLDAVVVDRENRSEAEEKSIRLYHAMSAKSFEQVRAERRKLVERAKKIRGGIRKSLVSEALDTPRTVRVLPRGNWQDESGEIVLPATPAFLPPIASDKSRLDRLDLANWIVAPENPLTARAFVNRLWKVFYGRGLSRDLSDLGGQGTPPTHPELLDWLAAEFIESGWDVKHLVKLMVMAEAYQQTSTPTAEQLAIDPLNQWFAYQNRWRIEAEFVRDYALSVSGLLYDDRVGGSSVKPYQPDGYWDHLNFPTRKWEPSQGNDLYRRSMYTFWCRTFLHPSMVAFDAPSREECTAQRSRSNVPQQTLVLLNDPIFVETARVLAARIATESGTTERRASWALEQTLRRSPSKEEVAVITTLYENQIAEYRDQPDAAAKLVEVGEASLPKDVEPAELAAWTQVARALLCAYETTLRY